MHKGVTDADPFGKNQSSFMEITNTILSTLQKTMKSCLTQSFPTISHQDALPEVTPASDPNDLYVLCTML